MWSLGNAFIPETADEADGEEDDEKRRKKKTQKTISYIANARTFFGIPVHKFPFIHLFYFPKPVSVSSDT